LADSDVAGNGADPTFAWHPDYAGKRASEVRAAIEADLRSDQRAYALALSGAEEHESDALQSTIALDRKWGPYDLDWAETDPAALADRIVAFERERERRRELIPYAAWRDAATAPGQPATVTASRQPAPSQRAAPPTWLMAAIVVAVVVLLVLLLVGR
jgi:hypothetical protein